MVLPDTLESFLHSLTVDKVKRWVLRVDIAAFIAHLLAFIWAWLEVIQLWAISSMSCTTKAPLSSFLSSCHWSSSARSPERPLLFSKAAQNFFPRLFCLCMEKAHSSREKKDEAQKQNRIGGLFAGDTFAPHSTWKAVCFGSNCDTRAGDICCNRSLSKSATWLIISRLLHGFLQSGCLRY